MILLYVKKKWRLIKTLWWCSFQNRYNSSQVLLSMWIKKKEEKRDIKNNFCLPFFLNLHIKKSIKFYFLLMMDYLVKQTQRHKQNFVNPKDKKRNCRRKL